MSGLECSEVDFSHLDLGDRIDSDYYTKEYLALESMLDHVETRRLGDLSNTVASAFYPAATHLYEFGDLPFARCVDCINSPVITNQQDDSFVRIPTEFAKDSKGISIIKQNEIIITKVGTPCYSSIVDDYPIIALSRTVLGLTDIDQIDPYYLMIFLRSKYGFSQLYRQRELTIQYQLTLARVKNVDVFIPTEFFQEEIKKACVTYTQMLKSSRDSYVRAQTLLSYELGLDDWQPSDDKVSVRSATEVAKAERWDAEFYQPKYDEILGLIQSVTNTKLGNIVNIEKSIEPGSGAYQAEGIPFLRVQDLTIYGFEETEIHLDPVEYKDTLRVKAGSILLTKDGTVGIAYKAERDMNVITSGAILHLYLNNQNINLDYLTLVLNSPVVKLQAEQDAGGSVIQHWKPSEIENVLIPLLPFATQERISQKVRESFMLRQQSLRLLEAAKRAVEIAIEQDENTALAYLKSQTELYTDADDNLREDRTYLKVAEPGAIYETENTKGASDHE